LGLCVLAVLLFPAQQQPGDAELEVRAPAQLSVAALSADPEPTGSIAAPDMAPLLPKPILLASEKAEAERLAAIDDTEPGAARAGGSERIQAAPVMKLYRKVKVLDGATIKAGNITIRLRDVEAHAPDKTCVGEDGLNWPCGAMAKTALTRLIRYRAVECELPPGGEAAEMACRCHVAGTDLSAWMVRRGWATPKADDPDLKDAHLEARKERAGLWRGSAD
jgi:endonuclease YncB( thermonuclease family)